MPQRPLSQPSHLLIEMGRIINPQTRAQSGSSDGSQRAPAALGWAGGTAVLSAWRGTPQTGPPVPGQGTSSPPTPGIVAWRGSSQRWMPAGQGQTPVSLSAVSWGGGWHWGPAGQLGRAPRQLPAQLPEHNPHPLLPSSLPE